MTRCEVCGKEIRYDGQKKQWYHHLISDCPGAASGLADDNNHIQPATTPPDLTEQVRQLVEYHPFVRQSADIFCVTCGQSQYTEFHYCFHGFPLDVDCPECGSENARRTLHPEALRFKTAVSRMAGWGSIGQVHGTAGIKQFHNEICEALAEAATQGQVAGIERAAEIAHMWAASHSCDAHDDNPCCHVRTGATIEERIKELTPDAGLLDRVRNEAATAALEQERKRIREIIKNRYTIQRLRVERGHTCRHRKRQGATVMSRLDQERRKKRRLASIAYQQGLKDAAFLKLDNYNLFDFRKMIATLEQLATLTRKIREGTRQ